MNTKPSEVDPCVFSKLVDSKIKLIAGVHVDDEILGGTKPEIEWFKQGIGKRFKHTDEGKVKKHLGIWFEWCKDDNGEVYLKLSMPKLFEEIAQKAEEVHEEMCNSRLKGYDSPGVLGVSSQEWGGDIRTGAVPVDHGQEHVFGKEGMALGC